MSVEHKTIHMSDETENANEEFCPKSLLRKLIAKSTLPKIIFKDNICRIYLLLQVF